METDWKLTDKQLAALRDATELPKPEDVCKLIDMLNIEKLKREELERFIQGLQEHVKELPVALLSRREWVIFKALAEKNLNLAACEWSAWREKGVAYSQTTIPDPFEVIYRMAGLVLLRDMALCHEAALVLNTSAPEFPPCAKDAPEVSS